MNSSAWAAAAAALATGMAGAQPRFERNPLYPVPVLLEGRVDVGYAKDPFADSLREALAEPGDPTAPGRQARVRGLTRSFLRLSGTETLDGGYLAHFRLDHSFDPATGASVDPDRFFDAEATVGLAHPQGWRLELGRREQPAWAIARLGDPWAGDTVASPGRWLYAPLPATAASGVPRPDPRSDQSITVTVPWQWPGRAPWALTLQSGHPDGSGSAHGGAGLRYTDGALALGAGYQSQDGGAWSLPLAATWSFGFWSVDAAHTRGRVRDAAQPLAYDGSLVGAHGQWAGSGDIQRHEWRAALSSFRREGQGREWKLGAGYRYHLGRRSWLQLNTAWARAQPVHADGPRSHWLFDAGLVVQFARDLRVPQEPW